MIDIWDHETNATEVYRQASIDPSEPPGPHDLAEALMGRYWVSYERRIVGGLGCYSPHGKRERICLRPDLKPIVEGWVIYHELAERHLYGVKGEDGHELACDQLAACLRAPREAFNALVRIVGFDLPKLAKASCSSETSAALRYGETTSQPLVVVAPLNVRTRGDEWAWPTDDELRRLARARILPQEVRRHRIDDDRGRVVFMAA